VRITSFLATFDRITISESPDKSPTDQSQTGALVAQATGPWAVNLSKGGPIVGKSGDDRAIELTTIANQNLNGNAAFDAATRYAFGYSTVAATASAQKLGFDAQDEADYAEMVAKGYVVLYVGTAEFKGTSCTPASDASLDALPKKVSFRFGFKTPVTYVNCTNPDYGDDVRGIQVKGNAVVTAQLTMHADHPFWDAYEEDAPLRFDQVALVAASKGITDGSAAVTFEDFAGVPLAPVTAGGKRVTARVCAPATGASGGELSLDAKGQAFADVQAYMAALQKTQGHLNADGLCAVAE
jgi:hypothetical protein